MFEHLNHLLEDPKIQQAFAIQPTQIPDFLSCCELALQHFSLRPLAEKLRKSDWYQFFPAEQGIGRSFLNTKTSLRAEDGIYVLSKEVIGTGSGGRVKWALRIDVADPRILTVKIQLLRRHRTLEALQQEAEIGLYMNFFIQPAFLRPHAVGELTKSYLIGPYAGITLNKWLQNTQLTPMVRLEVAIKFCAAVRKMHGENFPERRPVMHRDLTLNNVLIDPRTGQVTIGDFGQATFKVGELPEGLEGTPWYWPVDADVDESLIVQLAVAWKYCLKIGLKGMDMVAFKRVLWMPYEKNLKGQEAPLSLLEDDMFESFPDELSFQLNTHVVEDACSPERMKDTVLEIEAKLILFLLHLKAPIKMDLALQEGICQRYHDEAVLDKRSSLQALLSEGNSPICGGRKSSTQGQTPSPLSCLTTFSQYSTPASFPTTPHHGQPSPIPSL